MSRYFLSSFIVFFIVFLKKDKTCIRINWIAKIMDQFYYLTLSDIGMVLRAVSYFSFESQ